MPLAPIPEKNNNGVFGLIGKRNALYQLFLEGIADDDQILKEAAVSYMHHLNTEKYKGLEIEELTQQIPHGWDYMLAFNGKGVLFPMLPEEAEAREVVCFLRYEGHWYPYLLNTSNLDMLADAKMIEVFCFTHSTWSDPQAMNSQKLVKAELIDSAEVVLRVPPPVVDYILTTK